MKMSKSAMKYGPSKAIKNVVFAKLFNGRSVTHRPVTDDQGNVVWVLKGKK